MNNKVLLICLGLLISLSTMGQGFQFLPDEHSQRLYSYDIINNGSYKPVNAYSDSLPLNKDNEYDQLVINPTLTAFSIKSIQDYVLVGVNHDTKVAEAAYSYDVTLILWCFNYTAPTMPDQKIIKLNITYDPDSGKSYVDTRVFKFSGYHKVIVEVSDITDTGTHATILRTQLPKNFYIMSTISVERYDRDAFSLYPASTAINSGKTLHVNWVPSKSTYSGCASSPTPYDLKPVEYELEWQYIDDYTYNIYGSSSGTPGYAFTSSSTIDYDFRRNSTRVRVRNTSYDIPLIYEHGAIVFRVRAIRPEYSPDYKLILYGAWNLPDQGTVAANESCKAFLITNPHISDSLNWQYSINFSEEGKYKHVINYFDGSLRNRQTQTKINSDNDYVIGIDKTYDYEGRASIQTLPTPFQQQYLGYRTDMSLHITTTNPYTAADFDILGCSNPDSISPLSNSSLAKRYYSSLNPDKSGMQKFVPDAKGYPFTQTIYSPDNQLLWQSGAGYDHQLWTNHGTRYEYMRATQHELNALFGSQAGHFQYYPKTVITDPNGQSSYTIQNHRGQTVATGLIGMIDTTIIPIDVLPESDTGSKECFNILAGTTQHKFNYGTTVENNFYAEKNGYHSLQYKIRVPAFPVACSTKLLTAKAYYSYEASNDCGAEVIPAQTGVLGDYSVYTATSSAPTSTYLSSTATDYWLVKGKYAANKILNFSWPEINSQVKSFVKDYENNTTNCYHDVKYFIRDAVETTQFPCVDSNEYLDPCQKLKKKMMAELWPGAKYGQYDKDSNGNFDTCSTDNSIFTVVFKFDTCYSSIITLVCDTIILKRYQSTCIGGRMPYSVTKNGHTYNDIVNAPVDTFIYYFNDEIAAALLPLHPEFCKLNFCDDFEYSEKIKNIETFQQAQAINRFLLDSIWANDPAITHSFTPLGEELKWFSSINKRLDSLAIEHAYSNAGIQNEASHVAKYVYKDQIQNFVFIDSTVKQKYFDLLKAYYIGNRGYLLKRLVDSLNNDTTFVCGPCNGKEPVDGFTPHIWLNSRMTLIHPSVFSLDTIVYVPTGEDIPQWIQDIYDDADDPNSNHSSMNPAPSQIQDSINVKKVRMAASQIDYIMQKLANCTTSSTVLATIRSNLETHVSTYGGVESLTPQAVATAITTGTGLSLSDLCHPFLAELNTYDHSSEIDYPYNCGKPELYDGLKQFLNRSDIITLMKTATLTGSSATSFALSGNSNTYEGKIAGYLSISNTATINAKSILDTLKYVDPANSSNIIVVKIIQIKVYTSGADTFRLYLKRKLSTAGYLDTVSGGINTDTVFCLNDDRDLNYMGYIARNTAVADLTLNSDNFRTRYLVWSNGIYLMSLPAEGDLLHCLTCKDIKKAIDSFQSEKSVYYYDDAYNHPLFTSTLMNYLNYKLGKKYTYYDYIDLMRGCALSDLLTLNRHYATMKIVTSSSDAATFINNVKSFTGRDVIDTRIQYTTSGNNVFGIDLNGVPDDSIYIYREHIKGLVSSSNYTYLPNNALIVLDKTSCSPSTSLSTYMSPYSTTACSVYYNGTAQAYNLYEYTGSYSTAKQHADMLAGVRQYTEQCTGSFVIANAELLRSADYNTTDKQDYLTYIYGLSNTSRNEIADSISGYNLKQRISGYSGNTVAYADPYCSKEKRNLYIYAGNQTNHAGYKLLVDTILNGVKSTFGSNKLFPAEGFNNMTTTGSLTGLMIYHKANKYVWYRYFNGVNTLRNVHIAPPMYPFYGIETLIMDSVKIGPGADSIYTFTVYMHYASLSSQVVECKGYTDFPLGYGRKVANVVLGNKPGLNYCLDSLDCEYSLLQDAIYAGKIRYQQYFDSTTTDITNSMVQYLADSTSDSLYLCSQAQKNQMTLYYYDLAGNLMRTVPPAGVFRGYPDGHWKDSKYKYGSLNELYFQHTPDGGNTEYFTDVVGRVAFSQNSKQRPDSNYSYTLHDKLGRVIETGRVKLNCSGQCDFVTNAHKYVVDTLTSYIRHLDRYEVVQTFYDTATINLAGVSGYKLSEQENLFNRVSAILYYESKSNDHNATSIPAPFFGTYYSYDMVGNVKTITYECMALDHLRQKFKRVDYDFDQISGKVNMFSYNRGMPDQLFHKYKYDADNRIIEVKTSKDGVIWNRDAAYEYYKHGPLASTKIGDAQLQSIEYAYTIQGWLKAINGDILKPDKDMGQNGKPGDMTYARDVMAMALNYFQNDYAPIDNTVMVTNLPEHNKSLFNGNIARQTMSLNTFGSLQRTYRYDQVQRLKLATYAPVDEDNMTVASPSDIYKNAYEYDADGNILTLNRFDENGDIMDSLFYTYPYQGNNMLLNVEEQLTAPTAVVHDIERVTPPSNGINYEYDSIGNMTHDLASNQFVDWNLYGKVSLITDTALNEAVGYDYDGLGNRVRKDVGIKIDSTNEQHYGEYYVNDANGNTLATYAFKSRYDPVALIKAANDGLHTNSAFIPFIMSKVYPYADFGNQFAYLSINKEPTWAAGLTSQPLMFYIQHSVSIFERLMHNEVDYLDDVQSYDIINPPLDVMANGMVGAGSDGANLITEILDFQTEAELMLAYFDQRYTLAHQVWNALSVTHTMGNYSANASAMWTYITGNGKANVLTEMMNVINQDIMNGGMESKPFYEDVFFDNSIFKSTNLRSTSTPFTDFETVLADILYLHANNNFLHMAINTWSGASTWLSSNTTFHERMYTYFTFAPAWTMNDAITNTTYGTDIIDRAIAYTNKLSALAYIRWLKADPILGPLTNIGQFSGVAEDTLSLAEHHIYGSSKLAVQYYNTAHDSLVNTYNVVNTVTPLTKLELQTPWYSEAYGDIIKGDTTEPWGNGHTDTFTVNRRLALRWYHITDHSSNIVAVIKDRKSGNKVVPTDDTFNYWQPNLADLADYYPFGMKMPSRLIVGDSNNYGYNGQRGEQDIYRSINPDLGKYDVHATAKFWEYNNRIARRWNLDPKPIIGTSYYSVFNNNSILYKDVLGDSSVFDNKGNKLHYDKNDKDLRVFMKDGDNLTLIGELGKSLNVNKILGNVIKDHHNETSTMTPVDWFNKVKQNGEWDLKNNQQTIFGVTWHYDVDVNSSKPHTKFIYKDFSLNGNFNAADIGNYHAGYMGTLINIPDKMQMLGAGVVEALKNSTFTSDLFKGAFFKAPYGDRKIDYYWNNRGMRDSKPLQGTCIGDINDLK